MLDNWLKFCCLLLFITISANATQLRIGLVLSGGGARGAAHIGVLKELEKLRIPIHAIAGTSMGALIGGAYASGVPLDDMERRVANMDWNSLFVDDPPRPDWPIRRKQNEKRSSLNFTIGQRDGQFWLPKGAISGQKVQLFLADLAKNADKLSNYNDMPIPFRAIATNLENGQLKVFDRGPLADALRASMSVPGIFAPVELEGKLYVDGGLVRNLPIDIVRTMGVDIVIAVNLGGSYLKREQLNNVFGVTAQMITILTEQNVQRSIAELNSNKDVLILPQLGDIESTNFDRVAEAIPIGEQAAKSVAPQLQRYQLSAKDYANWQAARLRLNQPQTTHVDNVHLLGLKNVNPKIFDQLIVHQQYQQLNRKTLDQDIQAIYGSGDFERIDYRLKYANGQNLLIVDAIEKSWGPGYLTFGLGLMNDHQGDSRFGLRSSYRQTWLNNLGAEWVSDITIGNIPEFRTELYQPLHAGRTAFVSPYLDLSMTPLNVYNGNKRITRYNINQAHTGMDIGGNFDSNLELRLGPYWTIRHLVVETGNQILPENDIQDSGILARLFFDTMDSGYVPRRGQRVTVEYKRPLRVIGGTGQYNRLYTTWQGAYSLGQDSLIGVLRGGTGFGDDIPYYDKFPLGGFLNLTGYANEQFRGSEMIYSSISYQHQVLILPSPIGRGLYLGGSLEAGQMWGGGDITDPTFDSISSTPIGALYSASLFFGADTWLGPIYLGWGISGTGNTGLYFLLGKQ